MGFHKRTQKVISKGTENSNRELIKLKTQIRRVQNNHRERGYRAPVSRAMWRAGWRQLTLDLTPPSPLELNPPILLIKLLLPISVLMMIRKPRRHGEPIISLPFDQEYAIGRFCRKNLRTKMMFINILEWDEFLCRSNHVRNHVKGDFGSVLEPVGPGPVTSYLCSELEYKYENFKMSTCFFFFISCEK